MTFSIVAHCRETGLFGVAVATAVPAVGSMCPFTRPRAGATSTQSWVNPYLAIDALQAIATGMGGPEALRSIVDADPGCDLRQIGLVDAQGRAAAWSGEACTPWFGHTVGDGFAIQGNMLTGPEVIEAMREDYETSLDQPLDERLMRALHAGDRAGGDKRGRQSAALRVQGEEEYPALDLRVDEHADPVTELRRVLEIARRQLVPFVEGMPRRTGLPGPAPDEVTRILALSPKDRPGGTMSTCDTPDTTGLPGDTARRTHLHAQFAPVLREIEALRSVDLGDTHPPIVFDPTLPYKR